MDPSKKKKKYLASYAKYSSIGFQMLAIILLGVFGGVKLDQWLEFKAPVFTIVFSILSVILAIYYAVKDLIRMDRRDKDTNSDIT
jgi:F0F1-type ATP synthase assembly protein I